jgi:glycoside hydrolase-like protein
MCIDAAKAKPKKPNFRPWLAFLPSLGMMVLSSGTMAGPNCEAGNGYVAVDLSSQVTPDFLRGLSEIGVGTVIRYYDWEKETIPGKTISKNELDLIKQVNLAVAVVFQHNNSAMATFKNKDRGNIDADRSLALAANLFRRRRTRSRVSGG